MDPDEGSYYHAVMKCTPDKISRWIVWINTVLLACVSVYFFFIPGWLVMRKLSDPLIRTAEMPREAWRLHRYLAPRIACWARERIASERGKEVFYLDVPGTEWPLFTPVFYLWATEHLQEAWEENPSLAPRAPMAYASNTVTACRNLLLDTNHHAFVRAHWGDDYLHEENVFFRSLLIAGLTSYTKLTGDRTQVPFLADQVDTLARDLDASPFGVLYDYPGECYPIDVFAAVAWIQRADEVTGADHSAFIERERRAFTGDRLDDRGLIPWIVEPRTGYKMGPSRGIVNAHVLAFARELYPDLADQWYALFEKHFWQTTWYGAGWREFYADEPFSEWTYDVDSGPIIGGFSPAANAFGIAAARVNGRLDHAYILTTQVLTAGWPLLDGALLGARLLSDRVHAPYTAESAILWQLTETPAEGVDIVHGGFVPGAVYIGYVFFFGGGLFLLVAAWMNWRSRCRAITAGRVGAVQIQFVIWLMLAITAILLPFITRPLFGFLALCAMQFFPLVKPRKRKAV